MDRGALAVRQFRRTFPEIDYQEHLRATDPQKYREHMASLLPPQIDSTNSKLISTIIYDKDNNIRVERNPNLQI